MPPARRRRRGLDEVRELLEYARENSLSRSQLAAELGVHVNTIGQWARRVREADAHAQENTLVPVRVVDEVAPVRQALELELPGVFAGRDVRLRVPVGHDPATLRSLLTTLEEFTC